MCHTVWSIHYGNKQIYCRLDTIQIKLNRRVSNCESGQECFTTMCTVHMTPRHTLNRLDTECDTRIFKLKNLYKGYSGPITSYGP